MTIAGWIITGLVFALVATLGIGATALNMERKRHEREENKIRQEGAENAQHTADIITEAEKIKQEANTGNHSNDLHTMAGKLHNYAKDGQ